jgi:hypothetical protein
MSTLSATVVIVRTEKTGKLALREEMGGAWEEGGANEGRLTGDGRVKGEITSR